MNAPDLEMRLKQAAAVAAPPRSITDDVLSRIGASVPKLASRPRWRNPVFAAAFAACTGIAAIIVLVFLLAGPSVELTLADVQAAVGRQRWVHEHWDGGQLKDDWYNLQTGDEIITRYDGGAFSVNNESNISLSYWAGTGVIDQAVAYPPGTPPPAPTSQTAWEMVVAPRQRSAATRSSAGSVVTAPDVLDGVHLVRFDTYWDDLLGNSRLREQLWADPRTHLPVRVRNFDNGAWITGTYDFPNSAPADIYALGVPRETPVYRKPTTVPDDVRRVLDAIENHHDHFLKNYRAVVTGVDPGAVGNPQVLEIIWSDGINVRDDHHLPAVELYSHPNPPLPKLTPDALVAWAAQHEPVCKQLVTRDREYVWFAANANDKSPKPTVQVTRHFDFPHAVNPGFWPQTIQWPCRYYSPLEFQLLPTDEDAPPGCIGLRLGGEGNDRTDFYIDPANDYVCLKEIDWTKHGADWIKSRQYTLGDFHRIDGHLVAGAREMKDFGDGARNLSPNTEILTIDVTPLKPTGYPPGVFDPTTLTNGAIVGD